MDETGRTRQVAIAAAIGCAALYVLIGIGVLTIGRSTQDDTTDLLGFGALMGAVYGVTAVALWLFRSRVVAGLIAAFQLIPLLGYVALAAYREPPFEVWGLLIKVCQLVVLAAAAMLALRARPSARAVGQANVKGQAA
jgi:hypothetical protein